VNCVKQNRAIDFKELDLLRYIRQYFTQVEIRDANGVSNEALKITSTI
jgi:hypothetical protein